MVKRDFIKTKGFTLIELMVVVVLIGILTGFTISILNTIGAQRKARDTQRINDFKTIQAALELYYSDNRAYPVSGASCNGAAGPYSCITGSDISLSVKIAPSYISRTPIDPLNNSPAETSICNNKAGPYVYYSNGSNMYILATEMENTNDVGSHGCNSVSCKTGVAMCGAPCNVSIPTDCYAVTGY